MEHLREIIKLKRKLYELPRTDELTKFNNLKNKNAKELITIPGKIIAQIGKSAGKRQEQIDRQLEELALLMIYNDAFVSDVIKLAKKWALHKRQFLLDPSDLFLSKQPGCISLWYDMLILLTTQAKNPKKTLLDEWDADIDSLLEYGFERYWKQSLEMLLLSGNWLLPLHRTILKIEVTNQIPQIEILVFADTSIKDIEQRWLEVQYWKSELYNSHKRNKPRKDLLRYLAFEPLNFLEIKDRKTINNFIQKTTRLKGDYLQIRGSQIKTLTKQIKDQIELLNEPLNAMLIY